MSQIIETRKNVKTETLHHKTGEIVESTEETTSEQIVKYPKTADFVMAFTKDLGALQSLTKGQIMTLFGLLQIVNSNNEVILNRAIKDRIAEEFGLKKNSLDVNISNLKKEGILVQIARGVYQLQPNLFGKGKWTDIKKMRMAVEWDFKKQTKKLGIETEYLSEKEKLEQQIEELEAKKDKLIEETKEATRI